MVGAISNTTLVKVKCSISKAFAILPNDFKYNTC